jgi:hypothetical protein
MDLSRFGITARIPRQRSLVRLTRVTTVNPKQERDGPMQAPATGSFKK